MPAALAQDFAWTISRLGILASVLVGTCRLNTNVDASMQHLPFRGSRLAVAGDRRNGASNREDKAAYFAIWRPPPRLTKFASLRFAGLRTKGPHFLPHISPFIVHGPFAFLSGQLGFDRDGELADNIVVQTTQCLANIALTLADAGLELRDVVKSTVFLTDKQDYGAFDRVYGEIFGDCRPARSTVIAQLAIDRALIEIEVVAAIKG